MNRGDKRYCLRLALQGRVLQGCKEPRSEGASSCHGAQLRSGRRRWVYGSATSSDANGYELYVIASAVVGGASLSGGKGSAISAMLGALLIVMMRQGIRTLHLDQNYEWIIIGTALIVAVVLDQRGFKRVSERFAITR